MNTSKIFDKLVVLDLANNHFGDVFFAKKIVNSFGKIVRKHKVNSTIKFQFRDLPNFIHKDFINSDLPYVRRFLDTKMSDEKFFSLFKCIKKMYPHDVKLQLYNVHAVTEGTDAQATVSVRIEEKGKTTVGQAADTDTLVASANAYLNALNKMIIKRKKTAPDEDLSAQA